MWGATMKMGYGYASNARLFDAD